MPPHAREPTRRDLLVFGALLPLFTAVLGGVVARGTGVPSAGWAVWVAGGLLSVAFAAVPAWRRAIYGGWMRAVYPVGWVVTHVILIGVFAVVITPIAVVMRLRGVDPLQRHFGASTYWAARGRAPDVASYFRQY